MSKFIETPVSLFLTLLFLLTYTVTPLAQSIVSGALEGKVIDINGNTSIEGAVVIAKHKSRGIEYRVLSRGDGKYFIADMQPGEYSISASKENYENVTVSTTGTSVSLVDGAVGIKDVTVVKVPPIALQKKGATSSGASTYTGRAERQTNPLNATRGGRFTGIELSALPLGGIRTFDDLAFLLPGVAPPPKAIGQSVGPGVGPGIGTSGQFAVNGIQTRYNNFTIDGSDNNDEDIGVRRQGFTSLVPQSIESLQEYNVTTLLAEPQYGRNLGAQADAISRSGGNAIHGTLYGFFTGRPIQARNEFETNFGSGQKKNTRAQYGFALGMPIVKDRTFFFGAFEQQTIRANQEFHFAVPTLSERYFLGDKNIGRTNRGAALFSLFPVPNNPDGAYGANTFSQVLPADADGTIFSLKLDHSFNKDHIIAARYNFTNDDTLLPVTGEALFSALDAKVRTQNFSFIFHSILSDRAVNEFRASWGRTKLNFEDPQLSEFSPFLKASTLPLTNQEDARFLLNAAILDDNGNRLSNRDTETGLSNNFSLVGDGTGPVGQVKVAGFSPIGVDVYSFPQRRTNDTFQFADTILFNFNKHRFAAGADIRRIHLDSALERNFRPLIDFNGAINITGAGGRDFFEARDLVALGAPTTFIQTQIQNSVDAEIGLRYWANSFFLSDQIRLSPNFTLTVGLRYELNSVPSEVNNRIEDALSSEALTQFIAAEKSFNAAQGRGSVSGLEQFFAGRTEIYKRDNNNIAPHFAFAWSPGNDKSMTIRGGYGIYYGQIPGAVISQSRSLYPFFVGINCPGIFAGEAQSLTFTNPALGIGLPGTLNGFPTSSDPSGTIQTISGNNQFITPAGTAFVFPAVDLVTPYAQHWGLTVEKEFKGDALFSIAYVGTKGTHLLRLATPNFGVNGIPIIGNPSGTAQSIVDRTSINIQSSPGILNPQTLVATRTFPLLGSYTSIESDGNSIYHSLQAQLNKRFSGGLQFTTAYTWAHAIDESSDIFALAGAPTLPQNSFNRKLERGDANFDVRHRFVASLVYDLPFAKDHKIFGGWQVASIATFQTGQPFTVLSGLDANFDGNLTDRLGTTAGIQEVNDGRVRFTVPGSQFNLVSPGQDGFVGRNTFNSPGVALINLAVNKHFKFSETKRLEVRSELFNLFNRTHYGVPVHTLFSPGIGRSVDTQLSNFTAQFALKFIF
ncbi:MAG: carboxypeptidase-like regulatory domain-containing protein [Acidobacteriota bacterium]